MTKQTSDSSVLTFVAVVAVGLVAVVMFIFTMKAAKYGAGTTVSKASRPMTLTAGDDVLSLEQDLRTLNKDETAVEESRFSADY